MLDDLGRIRTELRTVMTETEKLKSGLTQQKLIEEADDVMLRQPHGPSPLDAYLVTESKPRLAEQQNPNTNQVPVVHHYADAEHILRDVQTRRDYLETNLAAILRQRDEENLYTLVDNMAESDQGVDEVLRIRKDVDRKIRELSTTVQREIEMESQRSQEKPDAASNPKQKSKPLRGAPSAVKDRRAASSASVSARKPPRKTTAKENLPGKSNAKRTKVTRTEQAPKPAPKPAPKLAPKPPPSSETYLTSVYGRQPYHPQRITSKAPYLHYQSPVNPRTAAITAALLGGGTQQPPKAVPQDTHRPLLTHENPKHGQRKSHPRPKDNARFYFHPAVDISNAVLAGVEGGKIGAPVEGYLVPIAVPLGKPKTDPSLRLPLPTFGTSARDNTSLAVSETMISQQPPASTPKPQAPLLGKPNVAVITIRDEGAVDETDHLRKRRKDMDRKKKQGGGLGIQVLPQLDIDSFTESSCSLDTPRDSQISEIQQPITRPGDSEYEELRNYFAVRDTGAESKQSGLSAEVEDDDKDELGRLPTPDNPLTFRGHAERERLYHGPAFPPQHPPLPSNPAPGVLDADNRVSEALEDRALEWVEQELLARIVSEMNRPIPDPTAMARPPEPSPESSIASDSDDGGILAVTIGLGGMQLFVDAGIPVDRDLVAELIKDVITDQITATLGYPQPVTTPRRPQAVVVDDITESHTPTPSATPLPTPVPTPDYTPPESEASSRETPVGTPDRTLTSPVSSVTEETVSSAKEQTPPKETTVEEDKSKSEISELRSPVPTPVATPTGSQTLTASVSTPEPSVREPEVSDVGSFVSTPQATVRTPTPPPEPSIISETSKTETPPPPSESSLSTPKIQVTVSPSSMTTSTLSTSGITSAVTTTEEELSEGQLIQPYVHFGQFSEGEYAVPPGAVGLAIERNLPLNGWDSMMLGRDEDSRNELIRTALHGLLRRKENGPLSRVRVDRGGSSSSETSEPTSMGSTLKDTDDIKEDSLADATQSEGEIILPRDPVSVLVSRLTRPPLPPTQESEGEITTGVAPARSRSKGKPLQASATDYGEISPGELRTVQVSDSAVQSPGEISANPPRRVSTTAKRAERVFKVRQIPDEGKDQDGSSVSTIDLDSPEHTQSRSLHTSDLHRKDTELQLPHKQSKPRVIQVGGPCDDGGHSIEDNGLANQNEEIPALSSQSGKSLASVEEKGKNGGNINAEDDVDGGNKDESPPAAPTRIQVTIPLMDMHESSVNSEGQAGNEDTFGDVSSISGGDF